MAMDQDVFFAIFSNGKYTSADKWDNLPKNDLVKLYLHGHFHHSHITTGGTLIPWYRYEILDKSGAHSTYKVGDFEVINIHPDNGLYNFFGRQIDILDTRLGTVHNYNITKKEYYNNDEFCPLIQSFYEEMTEVLIGINELGSWRAYEQSIEMTKKDEMIKRLEQRNEELQNEIDALKNEQMQ